MPHLHQAEALAQAPLDKLTSLLLHPFPKVRNEAADTLFAVTGMGKGVNWVKAGKEELRKLREELKERGLIVVEKGE